MKTFGFKNNDVYIKNGQIALINGGDEISQNVLTLLEVFRGEYFYNMNYGTPYFETLRNSSNINVLNLSLRAAILSIAGITKIINFRSYIDSVDRIYEVFFSITTKDQSTYDFNQRYRLG